LKEKKRSTLQTIANNLGLSRAAVSKALSNKSDISKKTIDLVNDEAKKLNYIANASAGALVTGRSEIVVGVFAQFSDASSKISAGINEVLSNAGYKFTIISSDKYYERQIQDFNWARRIQADGIIIDSLLPNDLFKEQIKNIDIPCVRFGLEATRLNNTDVGQVYINEVSAAKSAIEKFIECGHKKIGLLMNSKYNVEKIRGAHLGAKKQVELRTLHIENLDDSTLFDAVKDELSKKNKNSCTAFLCSGDLAAFKLIDLARSKNIICPRDISVIGFDDVVFSQYMEPALSTVRVPCRTLGIKIGKLWLQMKQQENSNKKLKKYFTIDSEFINRSSVGPKIN